MLERPINRLDVFRTGQFISWFRGKVIIPEYHFEFVVEDYLDPFAKKANHVFAENHVNARVVRQKLYGNLQYRIASDDFQWIVDHCPSPPTLTAETLLLKMKEKRNTINALAYDEFEKLILRDIKIVP